MRQTKSASVRNALLHGDQRSGRIRQPEGGTLGTRAWAARWVGGRLCRLAGLVVAIALCGAAPAAAGSSVFYIADQETNGVDELYRVDLTTFAVTKLNSPLVAGGDVWEFVTDPKGKFVIYLANQDSADLTELYRADLTTGSVTKISAPLTDVRSQAFEIHPKRKSVIYLANKDGSDELHRSDLSTGAVTKLAPPVDASLFTLLVDPRGKFVAYAARQDDPDVKELYRVDLATGTVTKVNTPFGPGAELSTFDGSFKIDRKGKFIGYVAGQPGARELYRADLGTGGVTKINPPLAMGSSVFDFDIARSGKFIVYIANQDEYSKVELYRADLRSGTVSKLNPPLVSNGNVSEYAIDPRGKYVVYRADQEVDDQFGLYYVDLRTGASGWLADDVGQFAFDRRGRFLNYVARNGSSGDSLKRFDLNGHGVELAGSFDPSRDVTEFAVDPKKKFVVFRGDLDTDGVEELYAANLSTLVVTKLNPPLTSGGDVQSFGF